MKDAADQLEGELNNISITEPDIPILHNFDASPSIDSLEIKSKLKNQLFKPVQWVDTMNHIKNYDGIVIECGPGKVLTGLAKTNGLNNILSMVSPTFNDELQQLLWVKKWYLYLEPLVE